jgi:hypothetical protein
MRLRRVHAALAVLVSASAWGGITGGCQGGVVGDHPTGSAGAGSTAGGAATTGTSTGGTATTGTSAGGAATTSTTTGPGGASTSTSTTTSSSSGGGQGGSACVGQCGPAELCDPAHLGFDDDCNGQVDEGCPCQPGQAHWCFKGDPVYRGAPGCFDGTELCTSQGMWGPCIGGVHAVPPDNCFLDDTSSCHALSATPYAVVDLSQGIGGFGMNAVPGSQSYAVACPEGVSQCPGVAAPAFFNPQQSGEYTVTYTKSVPGSPSPVSCTFPLIVAGPGLRVELSWEHHTSDMGVDLDLHVHRPADTGPWGISPGVEQDCTWSNCTVTDFAPPAGPESPSWFAGSPAMPPTPVNWYDAPVAAQNLCYNDPAGGGQVWQSLGMGCHDPRLDADDITCDDSVTDPSNPDFCAAENANIDYPPTKQWIRVAVDYYSNHGLSYDVHPEVKIFCDGGLAGDLGPHGYYAPEAPVTFEPSDGASVGGSGNRFWIVADVMFESAPCGRTTCTVTPTYADPTALSPLLTLDTAATQTFAPPYPP